MNPTILSGTRSNIALAAAALRRGEIVGMPTETVYGLAADAGNAAALAKVFAAKGRPADHPLIVHVADAAAAKTWASVWPETAQKLADAFWPGPMTLIVQRAAHVLDAVTGGQPTVGIRVPAHPLALALLNAFDGAVAAPSANKFGHVSPTTAAHVAAEFSDSNLLILDGGACDIGVESTIIDVSSSRPRVLRPGRIRSDDIEQLLGVRLSSVEPTEAPRVSGSLDSHYAPRTKTLMLVTEALNLFLDAARDAGKRVGLIHYSSQLSTQRVKQRVTLDGNNAQQFEHDIYAKLRMLDDAALDLIVIEAPPTDGHWDAVNDRLQRATFSSS
ncbi:MAG: threonylcarbamoyl-AMP synthase [Betaproteobacteria bacterium]|nr:MAG: threonylcarbamoyl-AMP synthase [Betaproteobacteria bacterium]